MKRSPLRAKRPTPRRDEGRVQHERIRPKESAPPTAEEREHFAYVIKQGCVACGTNYTTIHHVTASIHGGRIARSHRRVVGLCPRHHQIQFGPRESVEALGHGGFYRMHGVDLLATADRLWEESHV